jgi:hypothetical protein
MLYRSHKNPIHHYDLFKNILIRELLSMLNKITQKIETPKKDKKLLKARYKLFSFYLSSSKLNIK